jgi:hypothetical protein
MSKYNKGVSKFINNSSNYSEEHYIKNNLLKPVLEKYNNQIKNTENLKVEEESVVIPNNNKKYYLFIINKNEITTNQKENYNILYFFPENESENCKLEKNMYSDFFMEIDYKFNKNYLFEGYMYNHKSSKRTFLITDILIVNTNVVTSDYNLRFNLINELASQIRLKDLNGHLDISIHPVFKNSELLLKNEQELFNEQIYLIFKNNFIFKDEINSIETIKNKLSKTSKKRYIDNKIEKEEMKIIKKGNQIDIYLVFNIKTNNKEGILYVRTLEESRKLKELIIDQVEFNCKYNNVFKKWQILY